MGDHTETIQIEFDPKKVSFDLLLRRFWMMHDPSARKKTQYASRIFYHTHEQRRIAERHVARIERSMPGIEVVTSVEPYTQDGLVLAEHYHQKYMLQQDVYLWEAFSALDAEALVDSFAAMRVNGMVAGHGTPDQLEEEVAGYGLTDELVGRLRRRVARSTKSHWL